MPTKTDRILSYLPRTFQTVPRAKVLYPVVDAFGNELLLGENSLAEIMLSHWVDFADKNAERINDLEKIAALYALAPRRDEDGLDLESVEEFREHLKRYVRTFLEGTVTVQGVLRITAEALSLRIAHETEELDRWWTRLRDEVVTVEANLDDATPLLNFDRTFAAGAAARAAEVTGTVDLSAGIELTGPSVLRFKVDGGVQQTIDFAEGSTLPTRLTLARIVEIINQSPRRSIARHNGRFLTLASTKPGPTSRIELLDGPNDITSRLLGLASRAYRGTAATAAQVVGDKDLSHGVDLSSAKFLRIEIDGQKTAEIDCAGSNAANTSLTEIREAINRAFGVAIATDDGKHLILTSPTKGFQSGVSIVPPAAQNAAEIIFGAATVFRSGRDDQPARVNSVRDLRGGIDLSERANLRLRIAGGAAVTINCAGVDPAKTQRIEIVTAINDTLKTEVANVTERGVSLTSPTAGTASQIVFEADESDDAAPDIFGIVPLTFLGSGPTTARIIATPRLTRAGGINPWAADLLLLAVDGGPPVEINLRRAARPFGKLDAVSVEDFIEVLQSITLDDVVTLINQSFNFPVAATDGDHLLLASPTTGGAGSLEIKSSENTVRRRFVTRAIVTDEATPAVFGFDFKEARGDASSKARLAGTRDLSQSIDLSKTRLLRLKIDTFPVSEIDCAGPRPRATTLDEIVGKINETLGAVAPLLNEVASHDGKHLLLTSPSSGADSRIAFETPFGALEALLGIEPETFRGSDETQVKFSGTVDVSAGIDLDPNAAIKIGFDDKAPIEITLAGPAPNHKSILEINTRINETLQTVRASSDGKHIVLTSEKKGTESNLNFAVPAGHDVTKEIFGITAPLAYQGDPASSARIIGRRELAANTDLRASRFLRLSVDGKPHELDCAAKAVKPEAATLPEIVDSINTALKQAGLTKDVATHDGKHLILTSPTAGAASQLSVGPYAAGDARKTLLGETEGITSGSAPTPASIIGEATLLAPVNLSKRSLLRITVDNGRPRDIDVAGVVPAKTFLDEIVSKINAVFPSLASATDDDKLKLTSPAPGEESRLSVLPLRYFEVVEYTTEQATPVTFSARHRDDQVISNEGAADTHVEIQLTAPQGTVGPTIVNEAVGWSVRLFKVIEVGESISLRRNAAGELDAEIVSPDGSRSIVPGSQILVGPLGAQVWTPFEGTWKLVNDVEYPPELQLNNPKASSIVLLRARDAESKVEVQVVESDLTRVAPAPAPDGTTVSLQGRVSSNSGKFSLVDANGKPIAALRAGPRVNLKAHEGSVVKVTGPFHPETAPLMIVQAINGLFDVTLKGGPGKAVFEESYSLVTIGTSSTEDDSLARQVNGLMSRVPRSNLVTAVELDKATILSLPRGTTRFRYLDCLGSRFGYARFGYSYFPDGVCGERGIFGVSRFSNSPPERIRTVFASADPFSDPPVTIEFRWVVNQPGTFVVNLPADLPARFGARFGEARFSQAKGQPELYAGAVAEPPDDKQFLTNLIADRPSLFVKAERVPDVDLGWSAVRMPFRKPQFLTLGKKDQAARLYLKEDGLKGFIKLEAKTAGAWGNEIAVSARQVGPAIYDVSVIYHGGRFESARSVVLGRPIADVTQALLKPGPVGVLMAKAAGVRAAVTRDRAEYEQLFTPLQTL